MWRPTRLYSQNLEDLYLWRLFCNQDKGFYIDAGAWDPEQDSVTKIFYDQGWSGINIEPVIEHHKRLADSRGRDINLQLAVSDKPGTKDITTYGRSGLHSFNDYTVSEIQEDFKQTSRKQTAQVVTLEEVILTYCDQGIDFLKLDIEGEEEKAIQGANLEQLPPCRLPKVILLEATRPNSRLSSPSRKGYTELLASTGYKRFFFDGLNDYFCREIDHKEFSLKSVPPNIFDGFPVVPGHPAYSDKLNYELELAKIESATLLANCAELERQIQASKETIVFLQEKNQELSRLQNQAVEIDALMVRLGHAEREASFYYQDSNSLLDKLSWWRSHGRQMEDLIKGYSRITQKVINISARRLG